MPYSPHQQVFALSMASNLVMRKAGTPEALQRLLAQEIARFLADDAVVQNMPGWQITWGPAVWQAAGSDQADQAMVVFSRDDTDIVAIAATNSGSWYDWLIEDLNIFHQKLDNWPGAPEDAWISQGTNIGIGHLLDMQDRPGEGDTLVAFLRARAAARAARDLVIAGHSLGGALAPALALRLFTAEGLSQGDWRSVRVFPTAGFAPGNDQFAAFFATHFPPQGDAGDKPYAAWNSLIWNTLDIVPRAWDPEKLTGLTTLYGEGLAVWDWAKLELLEAAVELVAGPSYRQLPSRPLTFRITREVVDFDSYVEEMSFQHVEAYFHLLEVQELLKFVPP